MSKKITTRALAGLVAILAVVSMTGCAMFDQWGKDFKRQWQGIHATMTTYNEDGARMDQVSGDSINIQRDSRFDTKDSEGSSKNDSQVLEISIGNSTISHVGSSLVLTQDGVVDVMDSMPKNYTLDNTESGVPWLNRLREHNQNLWAGKSKTLMIRSQNGSPVAVFVGNNVEVVKTDIPKATQFRIDGKMLLVYRVDYTVYDTDLLK